MVKIALRIMLLIPLALMLFGHYSFVRGETVTENLICMDDTFVYEADPDESYFDGSDSCPNCGIALKLIPPGGHEAEARILLKYWLADLPSNVTITSAKLHFIDLAGSTNNSSDSVSFIIHEITSVWFESLATWNNQPSYSSEIVGSGTLSGASFNVSVNLNTDLVNGWLEGTIDNNGIIIVPTEYVSSSTIKTMPSYEGNGLGIYLEVTYDDGNDDGDSENDSSDEGGNDNSNGSSGGGGGGGCFVEIVVP